MKNVLLITGELFPLNNGARLHTYGYCTEISKISNFCCFSLYDGEQDTEKAEYEIRKNFNVKLFRNYRRKFDKLKYAFNVMLARAIYMYPVYTLSLIHI